MAQRRQERPENDPVSTALRELMRASHEATVGLARRLELGYSDVAALDLLSLEGPMGPVELGERLGMRSASATSLVDRLEAAGHIERRRDAEDRRRVTVVPTPHANRESLRAMGPMLAELSEAAQALGEDERRAVVAYLEEVTAVLRRFGAGSSG